MYSYLFEESDTRGSIKFEGVLKVKVFGETIKEAQTKLTQLIPEKSMNEWILTNIDEQGNGCG